MEPLFFTRLEDLRAWFEANHDRETELWIGYYKKGSGRTSVSYAESVEQALCFGWIDGIRRSIDEHSYANRFTPRRPGSNWSLANVQKVQELMAAGLMHEAGIRAFESRKDHRTGVYSFEQAAAAALTPEEEQQFQANARAWAFWESQPPSYRKVALHWVTSAKKDETRARRLTQLISDSEEGLRIALVRRTPKK